MKKNISDTNSHQVLWNIIFLLGCEVFAALCAFITNSILLTFLSITFTSIFSICAISCTEKQPETFVKKFMNINKLLVYSVFIAIALSPFVFGVIANEITFLDAKGLVKELCKNALPNFFGALIVCSLISHLSKFNNEEIILSILKSHRAFFEIYLRFSFMGAFLNCINYNVETPMFVVNSLNKVHLFVVVFSASVLLCVLVLRFTDKTPFKNTALEVYPTWTLLYALLFLISCGFSPIVLKNAKHEVVLLLFNTITALCIVWFFSYLIRNKTTKSSWLSQYAAPLMFSFFSIVNLVYNLWSDSFEADLKMQLLSGCCILVFALFLLLYTKNKRTP